MFYTENELKEIGFKSIGKNVFISNKASIYNPAKISIGSNVRIDDFCLISAGVGGISIGNYVHVSAYSSIVGAESVTLSDFSGLSARVSIYSSTDDYSGNYLTNPTVPDEYKGVYSGPVFLDRHVIIGSGSIILPNSHLSEGVSCGAMSLVKGSFESFKIIAGIPAKIIKDRNNNLLDLEQMLLNK